MVGCVTEWTNSLSTVYMCECTVLYLCSYLFESICVLRMHYKTTSAGEPHTQIITIVFILWFDVSWHDRLKHWKLATVQRRIFEFSFCFPHNSFFKIGTQWYDTHSMACNIQNSTLNGSVRLKKQKHMEFNRNVTLYASEKYSHRRVYCCLHHFICMLYVYFMYQSQCGSDCSFTIFVALSYAWFERWKLFENWKHQHITVSTQKFQNLFVDDALNVTYELTCVIKISANIERKIRK